MGDISRHRDIFLNTQRAIPPSLLDKCKLKAGDLTYLELGNYFTDVSQFRDPVSYIFAKRRVWKEKVLPKAENAKDFIQGLSIFLGTLTGAALAAAGKSKYSPIGPAAGALPFLLVSNDLLARIKGADDWIDQMLGNPIDSVKGKRRTDEEYGYIGQFFQHFIEGITYLLFAQEAPNRVPGEWAQIERIPQESLAEVFKESFTQYYPHEHTDQPPYVWDASKRPQQTKLYGVSRRQHSLVTESGIMNVVDKDYVEYMAEGLSKLETEWRKFKPADIETRRKALVRLGKLLHSVEDWFFHSNVVELTHLRVHTPAKSDVETDEMFVRRFVLKELNEEPEFDSLPLEKRTGQWRRLYRRLRFPVYERSTREKSAGIASTETSTLSLNLAYPAFPSQQDTAHTLLGALENLEGKLAGSNSNLSQVPPWLDCAVQKFVQSSPNGRQLFREKATARGITVPTGINDAAGIQSFAQTLSGAKSKAVLVDVLREWVPLIVTLLYESERQRLNANVNTLLWTDQSAAATLPKGEPKVEENKQLERHERALQPSLQASGIMENNYQHAIRLVGECGYLSTRGQAALKRAFDIDLKSQALLTGAPGAGGFLMQFALEMQEAKDSSEAVSKRLDEYGSIFDARSDNGAFQEIVGSHSLISKDTVDSSPFFNDAKVMACIASQSILHIFLDEVSSPPSDSAIDWAKILRHFIRYPVNSREWERQAMAFFRDMGKIPKFSDLPKLAELGKAARIPRAELEQQQQEQQRKGTKADALEEKYIKLEKEVSNYRHP
jgi:hypothetical protein